MWANLTWNQNKKNFKEIVRGEISLTFQKCWDLRFVKNGFCWIINPQKSALVWRIFANWTHLLNQHLDEETTWPALQKPCLISFSSHCLVLKGYHWLDFRIQHRIILPIFVLLFVPFVKQSLWASSLLCEVVICSFSLYYQLTFNTFTIYNIKIILTRILNLVFSPSPLCWTEGSACLPVSRWSGFRLPIRVTLKLLWVSFQIFYQWFSFLSLIETPMPGPLWGFRCSVWAEDIGIEVNCQRPQQGWQMGLNLNSTSK